MGKGNLQINNYLRKLLNNDHEISNYNRKLKFPGIMRLNIWVFNVCCKSLRKEHAKIASWRLWCEFNKQHWWDCLGNSAVKLSSWSLPLFLLPSNVMAHKICKGPRGFPLLISCCVGKKIKCMISFLLTMIIKQLLLRYLFFNKFSFQEKGNWSKGMSCKW